MDGETERAPAPADATPLGWGAFALPLFVHSAHHALGDAAPLLAFWGPALFYGGLVQLLAGLWQLRDRDAFGATVFATFGAFWMGVAAYGVLAPAARVPPPEVALTFAWTFLAFAVFTLYALMASGRVSRAVFLVLLAWELTEVLLAAGFFAGQGAGEGLVAAGGYAGALAALLAWYVSAAGLLNATAPAPVLPLGRPLWGGPPWPAGATPARPGAPLHARGAGR
jgi:succinate-acetate transporter protein